MKDLIKHKYKGIDVIFKKINESQVIINKSSDSDLLNNIKSIPEISESFSDANSSVIRIKNSFIQDSHLANYIFNNPLKTYEIYENEGKEYIHKNELILKTLPNITLEQIQNKLGLLFSVKQILNKPLFFIYSFNISINEIITKIESWDFKIKYEVNWHTTSIYFRNKISPKLSNYQEKHPLPENHLYKQLGYTYFNENLKSNNSISICLMDNGVYEYHNDIKNIIDKKRSKSFLSNEVSQSPNAKEYHGTWCAGILSAKSADHNGHNGIGVGTKLVSYRIVAGTDNLNIQLSNFDLINAFYSAAFISKCDVINCSWVLEYKSDFLYETISDISKNGRNGLGLPIVISAGNYFSTTKFPANHPDVFAISAVDGNKKPLKTTKWQSSFGNNILIAAPGNNIITTDIPDGAGIHELPIRGSNNYYKNYTYFHGTSAAAPIVSGCIARLLKHDNTLTLNEIKNLFLNDKSLDSFNPNFNNPNNNYYGAGIINLEKITKCFLE